MSYAPNEFPISVDVRRALEILSTNVFASPESCIRELIANAADGLSETAWADCANPEIRVWPELDRMLIISDNGTGMTEADVRTKLGTVFATSKEHKDRAIGRFGIGFYSCFPLCTKVEVRTRTRDPKDKGTIAVYSGGQSLRISSHNVEKVGTVVSLHLKEAYEELLVESLLSDVVHTFCNFVQYPIYVGHGAQPVNAMDAPWYHEVSEAELRLGLNSLLGIEEALAVIPVRNDPYAYDTDGSVHGVLFIQAAKNTPLFTLLSRRILVTESDTFLLDETLRVFLSGVVDADNLPLVLSRDTALQKSFEVESLKCLLIECLADGLVAMARTQKEDFRRLIAEHGPAIKKACSEHSDSFFGLRDYLPYRSSLRSSVTIPEYLSGRRDHTVIYADDLSIGASLIPLYNQANIEVLYMTDSIDRALREHWDFDGNIVEFKRLDADPPRVGSAGADQQLLARTDPSAVEMLRLLFTSSIDENLRVEVQSLGFSGPPAVLALPEDDRDALQMLEVIRMHEQQGRLSELPPEIQEVAKSGLVDLLAMLTTKTLILNESNEVVQALVAKLKGSRGLTAKTRWSDRAKTLWQKSPEPGPTAHTTYIAPLIAKFLHGQALLSSGLYISPEKRTEISQSQTELIATLLKEG